MGEHTGKWAWTSGLVFNEESDFECLIGGLKGNFWSCSQGLNISDLILDPGDNDVKQTFNF